MSDSVSDVNQDAVRETTIRDILANVGALAVDAGTLAVDDDLYHAGLSSFATVEVMLAVEDAFDVELPESALNRRTFQTIASLMDVVLNACGSE